MKQVKAIKTGVVMAVLAAMIAPVLLFAPVVSAQDTTTPPPAQVTPTDPFADDSSSTANIQQSLCAGVNLDVTTNCQSGITGQDATAKINDLIGDIINIFSIIVGVVSVIMIIYGGFRYITSGGDSSNVSSAKNTILYAIIGLIIVALAQTIVRFILGRVVQV